MSLFNANDYAPPKPVIPSTKQSFKVKGKPHLFIGRANQKLTEIIGEIVQEDTQPFWSDGDWSAHDMLFYLLKITGPANVYFSTWAISEYAIRQLYNMIQEGLILELHGIFDYRNGIRKPAELQFLKQITTDIKPAKCHAKVVSIVNETWGITIIGSMNFTRNPRLEAGSLYTWRFLAEEMRDLIMRVLKDQNNW